MRKIDLELFNVVKQGNLSMVQRCLNRGANVYAVHTVLNVKPIHVAARKGHRGIIEFLLNKGQVLATEIKMVGHHCTMLLKEVIWKSYNSY